MFFFLFGIICTKNPKFNDYRTSVVWNLYTIYSIPFLSVRFFSFYTCPAEDFAGKAAQIDRKDHLGK